MNIDIYNPDIYAQEMPHALFEELRRTQPVYWQEVRGEPGYWAVLKYADVAYVARNPQVFSAWVAGSGLKDPTPERLEILRNQLTSMDPPRHGQYRQPLAYSFRRRTIAQLERRVREITRMILADAEELAQGKGQVEFVYQVSSLLPIQVFGELAGLPPEDWTDIFKLVERQMHSDDPDISAPGEELLTAVELSAYCVRLAAQRRMQPPRKDLTTLVLEANFGGKRMTDTEFGSFFQQLVRGGIDTTVSLLSSGLLALLQHPDQLEELRANPVLIPGAVSEMLRWGNPVNLKRRTAIADTELRGVPIKAGDKVAMYLTSANRDEEVFSDPHRFDIHRSPNPHLAFGTGDHFCLGAPLTILEGKVFFEELLAGFSTIELAGEPKRVRSNVINGLRELPVFLGR